MDEIGNKNLVMGGLVKIGKWFNNVKSEYRIEVEASTIGVALNPFDRKVIELK